MVNVPPLQVAARCDRTTSHQRIRGVLVHDNALYKLTFYLLYLLTPPRAATVYYRTATGLAHIFLP